jgi:hypothetical protein
MARTVKCRAVRKASRIDTFATSAEQQLILAKSVWHSDLLVPNHAGKPLEVVTRTCAKRGLYSYGTSSVAMYNSKRRSFMVQLMYQTFFHRYRATPMFVEWCKHTPQA